MILFQAEMVPLLFTNLISSFSPLSLSPSPHFLRTLFSSLPPYCLLLIYSLQFQRREKAAYKKRYDEWRKVPPNPCGMRAPPLRPPTCPCSLTPPLPINFLAGSRYDTIRERKKKEKEQKKKRRKNETESKKESEKKSH